MAITDRTDKSRVAPTLRERPMKARLLVDGNDSNDGNNKNDSGSSGSSDSSPCNEGNDGSDGSDGSESSESGIDSSSQQHDSAERTPLKSHEGDTVVIVERQSKDSVFPELGEDSRGEGVTYQAGKKRKATNGDRSDDSSIADLCEASQIKPSNEPEHKTLADSSLNNSCPGQSFAGPVW